MCASRDVSAPFTIVLYPDTGSAHAWCSLDLDDPDAPVLLDAECTLADLPAALARLAEDLGSLLVGHQLALPFD